MKRPILSAALLAAALLASPAGAQQRGRTPPPPGGTYEISAVEVLPQALNRDALRLVLLALYPPDLRAAGIGGTVEVRFRVTEQGYVDPGSVFVVRSTNPELDRAAVTAIRVMEFRPAEVGAAASGSGCSSP